MLQPWTLHTCELQLEEVASHSSHAVPPLPQSTLIVPSMHLPFWQQPSGQFAAEQPAAMHAPAEHSVPVPHVAQALPPVPQASTADPGWHTSPAQQPPQLAVLHFGASLPQAERASDPRQSTITRANR